MRFYLSLSLLISAASVSAQQQMFLHDFEGKVFIEKKQTNHRGSPLLFKKFSEADVITRNGKVYKGMSVNVDIANDLFLFNSNDTIYSFAEDILEVKIKEGDNELIIKRGSSIDKRLPSSYLTILNNETGFLRITTAKLEETVGYGELISKYTQSISYYIKKNNEYVRIKLSKTDAENVFSDQWAAIQVFAKSNNISFKKEDEWRKLLNYYRTL